VLEHTVSSKGALLAIQWSNAAFAYGTGNSKPYGIRLDNNDVVPTGLENSPVTASVRRWRRVA
jgi:hypothetical protein